ncbi:hypothetical protein I3760_05G013100 [Carya illinoinensis]|uniref:Transmembrane protein n=1 Tax=Carya illinoinensis TaxID=32201 RepID=A0A922EUT8_CARIL|nr:hypothetical protein I3760_05G013100 [Carya illinoinensis]KAG6710656.1 hypothetical protein I3842_05G013700 [Carya illinoinensis]
MKGHSLAFAFNILFTISFILFLSYSMYVEGSRPLKAQSLSSPTKSFTVRQAYSGPSRRGSGH